MVAAKVCINGTYLVYPTERKFLGEFFMVLVKSLALKIPPKFNDKAILSNMKILTPEH